MCPRTQDGVLSLSVLSGERGIEQVFTASVVSAYVSQKSGQVNQSGNEDEQADAKSDRARLRAVLKFDAKNPLVALATIRGFLHRVQKFRYNTNRSLMPLPIAFDNLTLPQASELLQGQFSRL